MPMFLCSCSNCKFNIANFNTKIKYNGCECTIVFPCYKDTKYKFEFNDEEKFYMAQEVLMNVNVPENYLYYLARSPEYSYNSMYFVATAKNLILKTFDSDSGYFTFRTVEGIDKSDRSHIDGEPKEYSRFQLPYYLIFSRNIGYIMGQYIYAASYSVKNSKVFTQFVKISDFELTELWIFSLPHESEAIGRSLTGINSDKLTVCNHRKK